MVINNRKVGTIIKNVLTSYGIKPSEGCRCHALAAEMDKHSSTEIRNNIEHWTNEMSESIKEWRLIGKRRFLLPQPPLLIVKKLILYACDKSESA